MRNLILVLTWVVGSALLAGCGGPTQATVTGTVMVDGKPLERGVISFVPSEGEGVPATVNIESGKYTVQTTAGKKVVQISAPVVTDRRKEYNSPDAPMVEITSESLPEKFNTKSELTFDVQPGDNSKDWTVQSIKTNG